MELFKWILDNWEQILAILGVTGGSGLITKLIIDKNQNKKIQDIEGKIISMEKEIAQLKNDIETNTMFDNQFRQQVEKEYNSIKEAIKEIKDSLSQLMAHLLNKN